MNMEGSEHLFEKVVSGGYCIGCGACASIPGSGILMERDAWGQWQAKRATADTSKSAISPVYVCPFSEQAISEDDIAGRLFKKTCAWDASIGYYRAIYAGYVAEGTYRQRGSSGGMCSWILTELLKRKHITGVFHVQQLDWSETDRRLFAFRLSTTPEEVARGAKSRYYPVEMSQALRFAREREGRYAVVGVPCFIKAVRLLMIHDPVLAKRIRYCISLVCGHLKSTQFADMLAWQCDVKPGELREIDFRVKTPQKPASQYGIRVVGQKDGETVTRTVPALSLYGTDWGWGLFKYKSCDYCDDIVGETSDVSVGDAWLPRYELDSQGTNIVIVRNPEIQTIIETAKVGGHLKLDGITPTEIVQSQASSYFHRREALAFRLHLAKQKNHWYPPKRVEPNARHLNRRLRRKHRIRPEISHLSHAAFSEAVKANDFSGFVAGMEPLVRQYNAVIEPHWKRLARPLVHLVRNNILWLRIKRRVS